MKRSEMVNKIQDKLINMGFKSEYQCGCCHFEPAFEQASELLVVIEELGMLPPSCDPEAKYTSWDEEDE